MCILNLHNMLFRANFGLHIDCKEGYILVGRSKVYVNMFCQDRIFTYHSKTVLFVVMKMPMKQLLLILPQSNIVSNNHYCIDTSQANNIVLNQNILFHRIDHTEQRMMLNKKSKQNAQFSFIGNRRFTRVC